MMSSVPDSRKKRKVLLIGWDAADWKVINPLLDAGKMPVLQSLVEDGVMGKLATLTPVLSPMLWTSIATGKRPYKHGIYGFTEPDPKKGGVRPITNLSRKSKAIWNILGQEGLRSNVIGWWPSHPVEPIDGVMVSNHFQQVRGSSPEDWPMLNGTVHPPELEAELEKFRVHPSEIEGSQILPFVPKAAEVDQKKDTRVWTVGKLLAECASVHACSTAVMQNEEWDFMGIYYDAIDHFCHGFMKYHPPRQDHIGETEFEIYKDVVEGIYRFHDIMLGATLKLIDEDTTVILMSDHGFHPDHLRPQEIPHEQNGPAIEHSHYGIFVAKGPGIKKDATIFGANLLDVAPTVLSLFGLPIGEDMDGRVLTDIWEEAPTVKTIPSWEEVSGADGRHPKQFQYDPADDQALLKQLVDLGYVEDPGDDENEAERRSLRELEFNKARSYIDADRHGDSLPILERLVADWPQEFRFLNQLAFSYLALNRAKEARETIAKIFQAQAELNREISESFPEVQERFDKKDPAEHTKEELLEMRKWRAKIASANCPQHYLLGCLLVAENEPEKAVQVFNLMSPDNWRVPELPIRLGHLHLTMGESVKAQEYFEKAIEIDPQSARAYLGLMEVTLEMGRFQEAAEYGLTSAGLLYFSPKTHFLLGRALVALKHYERAAEAFEVTIAQNPNFSEAYEILADLYLTFLRQPERGKQLQRRAIELKEKGGFGKDEAHSPESLVKKSMTERLDVPRSGSEETTVTIVSGLPRSGTSLMMQMLEAGGMDCFTDSVRQADENNPKGYFELESIKELHRNQDALDEAGGKVVKIVAPLIPKLPQKPTLRYRIIFMERDLDEVLASQSMMLRRLGKEGSQHSPDGMKKAYVKLLNEVDGFLQNLDIPVLCISYEQAIREPSEVATRVKEFLGGELDERAMSQAVDASLYRERKRNG